MITGSQLILGMILLYVGYLYFCAVLVSVRTLIEIRDGEINV